VAFLGGGLQFGKCLGVVLGIIEFLTLFVEPVESVGVFALIVGAI